jgi:hypothetical protein
MQPIALFLALVLAAFAFVIGFKLGEKQRDVGPVDLAAPAPAPGAVPVSEPLPEPASESQPQPRPEPEAAPQAPGLPSKADMAIRAENEVITLVDTRGRTLKVEIMELHDDRIKARRQQDFRIVDIPFDMLSREDRAFVDFLVQQKKDAGAATEPPALSPEDKARLDMIFGDE